MFPKKRASSSSGFEGGQPMAVAIRGRGALSRAILFCAFFFLMVWAMVTLSYLKAALNTKPLVAPESVRHPVQRVAYGEHIHMALTSKSKGSGGASGRVVEAETATVGVPGPRLINDKTTFIIKTMDRPASCFKLLKSIYAMWPGARVIIGDDGDNPMEAELKQRAGEWGEAVPTRYIRMEPDAGLSATRNALVKATDTEYFVLLDDDFEFDGDRANITRLVQVLDRTPGLSLALGGLHMPPKKNRGKDRVTKRDGDDYFYAGLIRIDKEGEERTMRLVEGSHGPVPGFESTCSYVDIGINFFAARTADVAEVLWDPVLKLAEHEDFFLRMKEAGKKVAGCKDVSILHDKDPGDKIYKEKRTRGKELWKVALAKHGVSKLVLFNGYTVHVN